MPAKQTARKYGAKTTPIDLSRHFNFPRRTPKDEWSKKLAEAVRGYATGHQQAWGIPFEMAEESGPRAFALSGMTAWRLSFVRQKARGPDSSAISKGIPHAC